MNTSYPKTKAETLRADLPIFDRWEIPVEDRRKVIESAVELCTERNGDNSLKRSSRTVIAAMRLLVSFDRLSIEDRKLRTPHTPRPFSPPPPPALPPLNEDEEARAMELASTLLSLRDQGANSFTNSGLTLSSKPARDLPLTAFGASVSSPSRRDRDRSKGRPKR